MVTSFVNFQRCISQIISRGSQDILAQQARSQQHQLYQIKHKELDESKKPLYRSIRDSKVLLSPLFIGLCSSTLICVLDIKQSNWIYRTLFIRKESTRKQNTSLNMTCKICFCRCRTHSSVSICNWNHGRSKLIMYCSFQKCKNYLPMDEWLTGMKQTNKIVNHL